MPLLLLVPLLGLAVVGGGTVFNVVDDNFFDTHVTSRDGVTEILIDKGVNAPLLSLKTIALLGAGAAAIVYARRKGLL